MIIFGGGGSGAGILNDIGVLDLNSMTWIPESNINPPPARCCTTGVFVPSIEAFFVYGGATGSGINLEMLEDMWLFTLDPDPTSSVTTESSSNQYSSDPTDKSNSGNIFFLKDLIHSGGNSGVVGGVIGGLLAVSLLAGIISFGFYYRKKNQRKNTQSFQLIEEAKCSSTSRTVVGRFS